MYSVAYSPCTSSAFSELVNGGTRSHRADVLHVVWDTPSLDGHPLRHVAGVTAVDIDGHPPEEGGERERESVVSVFSMLIGREKGGPKNMTTSKNLISVAPISNYIPITDPI